VALIPAAIDEFLGARTPDAWLELAATKVPELLHDHANCELKAASTALGFIYRYAHESELAFRMSRLAREELRHFEQVRKLLEARSIQFSFVSASRYAAALRKAVRQGEPGRLVDLLIVGAFIEARSCERFAALVPHLPDDIAAFYRGLLASEARHFEHYLGFARQVADGDSEFDERVDRFRKLEADLVVTPDPQFRFHSGLPEQA